MSAVVELRGLFRTYAGAGDRAGGGDRTGGAGSAGGVAALRPTDLRVDRGGSVAVTGRSGSGKSTLLQLLGLLDRPTGGTYRLDGVATADLTDAERTALRGRRIGFVFQSFHLLAHRSAVENVELALMYGGVPRRHRRGRAEAALDQVSLAHRRHFLPRTLSGGERQRVAIARAIVGDPAMLLADEPTGNLDAATAEGVLDTLESLNRGGMTLMMVTHDPAIGARAGRHLRIDDGVVTDITPAGGGGR